MTKTSQPGWHFQNFKPNCVEWKQSRYSPKQSGASSLAFFFCCFPLLNALVWLDGGLERCQSGHNKVPSIAQALERWRVLYRPTTTTTKKKRIKSEKVQLKFFFFFSFLCQVCDASQRLAWLHYKQVVASSDWLAVGGEDRSSDTEV